MAVIRGNFGQRYPSANTLTVLHTCPADKQEVFSTIMVCNQSSEPGTFRVSHAVLGAADSREQYLYYDEELGGNESFAFTLGICLSESDELRVMSSNGQMSFNAYGERGDA